ncbi:MULTISPECIES: uracil phosphoribosyltransferase [Acetobacter]|uniref:Uracil phosphoribosyltransferase n=2 Tax=Acetobacter TaxID=434 RepID=F1YU58_9PROT|nr:MULTISPECIES: uracil phosphoribosyltransferase [Acetobacter]ATI12981.1 uracil phosphoribosyltransferase [Acetobacter pomorum]AXC26894.1 uracil phosphoribosyltransferase [Acetobacter sp. JWB]EGE47725.1 Uracil phosphoribosyltransferase [Acetobacter pomorum DM001]KAA8387382.1 uracil phosphoribosyltransferase [Acetobacter sp. DmW_136]KAA8423723.1 uracil phosphoribosyltransferase [Acetobacter pomorum]
MIIEGCMTSHAVTPLPPLVLDHPLIKHKLTHLRRAETSTAGFRRLVRELSLLMCYEATRELPLEPVEIQTPLEPMMGEQLAGPDVCFISILRAGNGLLDGMLDLVPFAPVGHIGLYRDPETLEAVEYYLKLPSQVSSRRCIVVDPMLATGHSAAAAITRLKEKGARKLLFTCLLSTPEGIACLQKAHPDVQIMTCSIDRGLDEHSYIVPGLGDAGDRLFGTR